MSTRSLRLPESIAEKVRELAARDGVSINQFIATAVAEKTAALETVEYLESRAARGSRAAFTAVLDKVPRRQPDPGDEWEPTKKAKKGASRPGGAVKPVKPAKPAKPAKPRAGAAKRRGGARPVAASKKAKRERG